MRQYYGNQSPHYYPTRDPRQNSWNSGSSTVVDWSALQLPLYSPKSPVYSVTKSVTRRRRQSIPKALPRRNAVAMTQQAETETCPMCSYAATGTDRHKLVRRHMKRHDETEELYQCGFPTMDGSVCEKSYNRRDNLRAHQKKEWHAHGGREKRLLRKRLPGGSKYRPDID